MSLSYKSRTPVIMSGLALLPFFLPSLSSLSGHAAFSAAQHSSDSYLHALLLTDSLPHAPHKTLHVISTFPPPPPDGLLPHLAPSPPASSLSLSISPPPRSVTLSNLSVQCLIKFQEPRSLGESFWSIILYFFFCFARRCRNM